MSGMVGMGRGEVWAMSARLLEVEWPQAFPAPVHVPNSDPPEPSHRLIGAEAGGALSGSSVLTANRGLLQAAPGESS